MQDLPTILLVEDDEDIISLLSRQSAEIGCRIESERDGRSGLEKALSGQYQLVILDGNLPTLGGFEICKRLRREKPALPILMLTSRVEEVDRVLGIELGADDYICKPFSIREVVARIKGLLRRTEKLREVFAREQDILRFGPLQVNLRKREVLLYSESVDLTVIEFDLLGYLALNSGRVVDRQELAEEVWGVKASQFGSTITTHMSRLRAKLEQKPDAPRFITTVKGVGYRFAEMNGEPPAS